MGGFPLFPAAQLGIAGRSFEQSLALVCRLRGLPRCLINAAAQGYDAFGETLRTDLDVHQARVRLCDNPNERFLGDGPHLRHIEKGNQRLVCTKQSLHIDNAQQLRVGEGAVFRKVNQQFAVYRCNPIRNRLESRAYGIFARSVSAVCWLQQCRNQHFVVQLPFMNEVLALPDDRSQVILPTCLSSGHVSHRLRCAGQLSELRKQE
jgi:hypothetical protein